MHINPDGITDKLTLSHITSSSAFKNNALRYLATEITQQRTLNTDIANDLNQLIQSNGPILNRNLETPNLENIQESDFTE